MYKLTFFLAIIFWSTNLTFGQSSMEEVKPIPSTQSEYEKQYQKRIKKEVLYDVYIPADLEDAMEELDRLTDSDAIAKFQSAPEDTIARKIHFSLGRWIIHNWGFDGGSRLSHWLKEKGIANPDDMAQFVIVSWHRKLNGMDLQLDDRILAIQEKVKHEKIERDKDKKVISVERRKVGNN